MRLRLLVNRRGHKPWLTDRAGVVHAVWCHYAERAVALRVVPVYAITVGDVRAWANAEHLALCDYCIGTHGSPRSGRRFEHLLAREALHGV